MQEPAAKSPETELVVERVDVRSGTRTLVAGVSFTLRRSEIAAVIGPNGAGKTTLLEAIVGSRRLAGGSVRYGGATLDDLRSRARVFSFMPDAGEPAAELRVSALVGFAARFGGVPKNFALTLAHRLGLEHLANARAGELSMGEKKRVALHGALCTQRPVVVLDEPLAAFDPLQLIDVLDVLQTVARAGKAILLSVHQLADAEKVADRILILDRGRLMASGSLDELRQRASAPSANLEQIFLRLLERRDARA